MKKNKLEFEIAKQLPGKSQLDRVRAARAMIHSNRGSETMALHAFMAIFHPKVSQAAVRELIQDLKDQGKK